METRLQLVPERRDPTELATATGADRVADTDTDTDAFAALGFDAAGVSEQHPFVTSTGRVRGGRWRRLIREERGAVTAEYAIVIMAAVAFAGLLVAILRSAEIRALLVQLVEDALGAAG